MSTSRSFLAASPTYFPKSRERQRAYEIEIGREMVRYERGYNLSLEVAAARLSQPLAFALNCRRLYLQSYRREAFKETRELFLPAANQNQS